MICVVTNRDIFPEFTHVTPEECIAALSPLKRIQVDTETDGLTPQGKICRVLLLQLGSRKLDRQYVIDEDTINIGIFKELLESHLLILANAKFDLMFLYNHDIHPLRIFDVMIAEQVIHLGWPSGMIGLNEKQVIAYMTARMSITNWDDLESKERQKILELKIPDVMDFIHNHCGCSLQDMCFRYLHVYLDKSVRGEIHRGLTHDVIVYAGTDVVYMEDIMDMQIRRMRALGIIDYAHIEMNFVPVCAYGEWCGIYLNPHRWQIKMAYDQRNYDEALKALDEWFYHEADINPEITKIHWVTKKTKKGTTRKKFQLIEQDLQGDLFSGFDTSKHRTFDWTQNDYVILLAKILGFDVSTIDKKKGEEKDSIEEDVLKSQKGINDDFLKYYFGFSEWNKQVTGYGQNYLDDINPVTGRLHPVWRQIGTISGRMTNSSEEQEDLMRIKKLGRKIQSMNVQVLPKTFMCRESFTNQYEDTMLLSCDYGQCEARLGAMIYNDDMMLKTFDNGWDSHSVAAKLCFPKELADIDVTQVKKMRPDLRNKSKAPEFACQFGGSSKAIASQLGCSDEEADSIFNNYMSGYKGMKKFQEMNGRIALSKGYVMCTEKTGGKIFWWDYPFWKKEGLLFSAEGFWDIYREEKKRNPKSALVNRVRMHMRAKSKWSQRMSLNAPTQHTGAEVFKRGMTLLYHWIVENNLWNQVKICAFIHDECVVEFPKNRKDVPHMVEQCMENAAAEFHTRLPIPADAAVAGHWVH